MFESLKFFKLLLKNIFGIGSKLITPIFKSNKIVSFIGTVAHLSDVGGHNGDIEAEDVFTEGIRIPPCKLYVKYKENNELFNDVIEVYETSTINQNLAR